ncbi:hypothetical protein FNV43_RR04209 [Rhamnella rubrinervis]|uniref:Uncharacterized protein n=1 Tax=Rhamnella rubrinervis TaxID=2594499 RepID=A0A8K0HKK8_9ROSA|nr:hypothetical protein FNV43_RR04209 [Rhamnella rubrinervis]
MRKSSYGPQATSDGRTTSSDSRQLLRPQVNFLTSLSSSRTRQLPPTSELPELRPLPSARMTTSLTDLRQLPRPPGNFLTLRASSCGPQATSLTSGLRPGSENLLRPATMRPPDNFLTASTSSCGLRQLLTSRQLPTARQHPTASTSSLRPRQLPDADNFRPPALPVRLSGNFLASPTSCASFFGHPPTSLDQRNFPHDHQTTSDLSNFLLALPTFSDLGIFPRPSANFFTARDNFLCGPRSIFLGRRKLPASGNFLTGVRQFPHGPGYLSRPPGIFLRRRQHPRPSTSSGTQPSSTSPASSASVIFTWASGNPSACCPASLRPPSSSRNSANFIGPHLTSLAHTLPSTLSPASSDLANFL